MAPTTKPVGAPSSGMISGIPFVAGHAANVLDAETLLTSAVDAGLQQGRQDLLNAINSFPEWKPYAENVKLFWQDGCFVYDVVGTDEEIDAVIALEYGTGEVAPKSVLRTQLVRLQDIIGQEVEKALTEAVGLA